jgi:hypothetical protein
MKVKAATLYPPLFIAVLLLQLYLPSFKANIFIQLVIIAIVFFVDRVSFKISYIKQLAPFIGLLFIGCIGTLIHKFEPYNVIKDIFHFLKPVTGLLIGYVFFKKIDDFKVFAKTIVNASIISAIIHFLIIIFLVRLEAGTIHAVREFSKDNFLELLGLFFLLFYRRFNNQPLYPSIIRSIIYAIILIASISLYFSRTMIVAGIILFISLMGYARITQKNLKIIGSIIVAIGLFYIYLYNTNIRRDKPGLEAFLYKVKIAPAEIFKTNIDRDNHKDLWDHWRGYEAKRAIALMNDHPSSYIFGAGHGSLVNLKFYAPLAGDRKGIRYISELHNGYMYILYKTGFIGLCIYLFILVRWYLYLYNKKSLISWLIGGISIIYFVSTLTITGVYNSRDIFIFIIGALLVFGEQKKQGFNTA